MDQLLVDRGLAPTRAKAQALILAGQVEAGGRVVAKAGLLVPRSGPVAIKLAPAFVSRGGFKLQGALKDFKLSPAGKVCLDVGASTGGFTDCLLQEGAVKVYAVDVGRNQLIDSLKTDARVVSYEQMHIQDLTPAHLPEHPDFCVVDVSFISLKRVLPMLPILLRRPATIVALVKPQFEVGPKHLKKGVVRSEEKQLEAVQEVAECVWQMSCRVISQSPSRLKGPKGNQEYFLHIECPA